MKRFSTIALCLIVATAFMTGCVSDAGERPDTVEVTLPADPGSGPFSCAQEDGVVLEVIDDFELGAASGSWFANNEICEDCQALADERRGLLALLDALGDSAGDTDSGGDTESASDEAVDDEAVDEEAVDEEEVDDVDAVDVVDGEGDTGGDTAASELDREDLEEKIAALTDEIDECRVLCDASQFPTIFDKPLPADIIPGAGRCGSRYSLHLTALKLIDWGANIGNILSPPEDVSEWDGIAFWARRSPYSRGTIRVEVADKFTDPDFPGDDELDGPYCDANYTDDNLAIGCDRPGGYAIVGPNWKFFKLPFAEMRQAGWGRQAPYLDLEALRSITFLFPAGTWDIWIDDVAYYKRDTN